MIFYIMGMLNIARHSVIFFFIRSIIAIYFQGSFSMKWLKRLGKSLLIGSAMGVGVALFTNLFFKDLIDKLENQTYYMRYHWAYKDLNKGSTTPDFDNGINIIDIDDRSQQKLGQYWNWDRSFHAKMLDTISKQNPGAVIFDVEFFDPEDKNHINRFDKIIAQCEQKHPGFQLPQDIYKNIASTINYDQQFIDATKNSQNVFHALRMAVKADYPEYAQSQVEQKMTMAWHDSLHPSSAILLPPEKRKFLLDKPIIDGAFPGLARAARDIGFVNIDKNEDGVIREIPLMYGYGNNPPVYLPISVRAAATLFGTPNNEIIFEPGRYIDIGRPFKAFKDTNGEIRFSYPGVTSVLVKAILENSTGILGLAPGKTINISSHLNVGKDSVGTPFAIINADILPEPVVHGFIAADKRKIFNLAIDSSLVLGPSIIIKKNSDIEWVLNAPLGIEEWYLSMLDLTTLGRLTEADFSAVKPGETKVLFYEFTVRNKQGKLWTSLPVITETVLKDLCKISWETLEKLPPGMRAEFGKPCRIPLSKDNRHIVTYFGLKGKTFKYNSYYDIMAGRVHGGIEGQIFIVGSTVPSMFDIVSVPIGNTYPGVEVHASLLHSFMTNTFVTRLLPWQDFLILLFVGIVIGFLSFFLKPLFSSILSVVSVFMYFVIAMSVFGEGEVWIEIARPILAIVITFTAVMVFRYITEEKDRKFLQSTFKQYLSPELIDMMYTSKQQPKLGGDEGVRTAYFTDIQGFSTFSEKLGSPTRLVELLNEYLTAMTDTLLSHYGTLDKYEGDAIIAFFGAPMTMEDHARQACLTALDMQAKLGDLRKKWISEGDKWPSIVHEMRMRVGVNSGPIVTGNMGSKTRMNYTMMGDTVNLAARLESASKQYGVFIMISHFTYEMVKNDFEVRQLDKITVVGKSEPIVVYELISEKGKWNPEIAKMADLYSQGLAAFYKQEWDGAVEILTESEKLEPYRSFAKITPSKKIMGYCREFKKNPPGPDWDGVIRLTSK
jgi:class 3 adenylate cyclase/CHASE2 domain-containing sensor protein